MRVVLRDETGFRHLKFYAVRFATFFDVEGVKVALLADFVTAQ
jgi:hypothetical protein